MRHKAGHNQYILGRWGWQSSNMATSFFGHLPLSLSLLYACPCPSPVTKQDALNYTRTLPSPFLRPLFVFSPFSHNCCATTVAADQATNIKFEINKSKQFSRPGDMQGKRGGFSVLLLKPDSDRSCFSAVGEQADDCKS